MGGREIGLRLPSRRLLAATVAIPVFLGSWQAGPRTDPALAAVLHKAATYVAAYAKKLSALVAEERYEQTIKGSYTQAKGMAGERLAGRRVTRSDFLLIRLPDEDRWAPFRDVFEVDGVPVRDRDERLQKLFLETTATALSQARRISDESARYNIGGIDRTVNMPVLPLRFLESANLSRFTFTRRGEDTIEGLRTWRVDYRETARPTLVKSSRARDARDVPASGSLWIDPATGRIAQTLVRLEVGAATMDATVVYRPADALEVWTPSEMREHYEYPGRRITGLATYSNFRRFQVTTEEKLKIPK